MKLRLQQISKISRGLLWLNLLSLDALLVALIWQDFFAREYHIRLALSSRLLLGLCAWLVYVGDRWLDGWKISPVEAVLPRHRFAQRHRGILAVFWLTALAATVLTAYLTLTAVPFWSGLLIAGFVTTYFVLYQNPRIARHVRSFKEAAIAVLFALATVVLVFPLATLKQPDIALAVAGWAVVCFLNCYGIACWEQKQDVAQRQHSLVTRWPALVVWFRPASWLAAAIILIGLSSLHSERLRHMGAALAISCVLLGALDWLKERVSLPGDWLRLAADFALLTPILFI